MTADTATRTATTVGAATIVVGAGLAYAPKRAAQCLRLRDSRPTRIIGLADLTVAPGLLVGQPRSRWMIARVVLNLAIIGYLIDETRNTSEPRALAAAVLLATITAGDSATAGRLWAADRRALGGK